MVKRVLTIIVVALLSITVVRSVIVSREITDNELIEPFTFSSFVQFIESLDPAFTFEDYGQAVLEIYSARDTYISQFNTIVDRLPRLLNWLLAPIRLIVNTMYELFVLVTLLFTLINYFISFYPALFRLIFA